MQFEFPLLLLTKLLINRAKKEKHWVGLIVKKCAQREKNSCLMNLQSRMNDKETYFGEVFRSLFFLVTRASKSLTNFNDFFLLDKNYL